MKSLLSLFIVLTVSTSFAQDVQWHTMSAPLHYTPTDIKKAGDMLYMTTLENTYFASEDNGDTWKIVLDLKPLMTAQTTGTVHFIDENNNIIMYPGMSSLSQQLLQSNDKGNTWKFLTIIGRSNILSITNWKKGFIGISSEYSENRGHILIHDTTQKNINTYYEENLFGKCFTLDSVYFINYSGIYSSPFDTIIPKKIIHFPNKTASFSLHMKDISCFITAENFLFFSHDNGKTWEKDTLPFIAKHIQKNSRNFYAIDKENHLWKLSNDGRQWGKFLSFPLAHDSITCFYADNDQLFFGGSKGLLRYSLRNSTWLNQSDLGSVSSYTVKLTDRGICVNPARPNSLPAIPLGFCHTKDLGLSWNIYRITPYGMMTPYIHSKITHRNGTFYQFDAGYNMMMSFGLRSGDFYRDIAPFWTYFLQKGDTSIDISRTCDSIRIYTKNATISYKFILPEPPYRNTFELPQLTFSLIKDTLFYSLDDSIRERKKYFSMNFGKSWSLYNNWKKKYAATGVPLRFGKYIRRFHPSEGFQIYNPRNDSWHTINDSRWGTIGYRDMDYNDSLIVVGHPTGIYYLTPDDIPALTDIQESPSMNNSIAIYPIPFDDKLNINALSEDAEITLYSVMGVPVLSQRNDNNTLITLETDLIPRGIYFLEIKTRNSSVKYSVLKL